MNLLDIVKENEEITEYGKKEILEEIENKCNKAYKKPNMLSVKGKFKFTAVQQDLLNYMFYKWNDIDNNNMSLKLQTNEIIKFFNYKPNQQIYDYIKEEYRKIRNESVWLNYNDKDNDGNDINVSDTFSLISSVRAYTSKDKVDKTKINKGTITLYFDKISYPIICKGLKEYYTWYNFLITFSIKGKYSKRLYDLFYAFIYENDQKAKKNNEEYKNSFTFYITYQNFIDKLQLTYTKINDIEKRVIIPALKELNNNTKCNIDIQYYINKKSKTIIFSFSRANILKNNIMINDNAKELYDLVENKKQEEQKQFENNDKKISEFL